MYCTILRIETLLYSCTIFNIHSSTRMRLLCWSRAGIMRMCESVSQAAVPNGLNQSVRLD